MPKDAVFTLKLDAELRDRFKEEAEAMDRSASQVVREMMREFVHEKVEAREYEKWFLEEVEDAIREADKPDAVFYTTEEVTAHVLATIEKAARKRNES